MTLFKPAVLSLFVGPAMLLGLSAEGTWMKESQPRTSIQQSPQPDLSKDLEDDEDGPKKLFIFGEEAVPPLIGFLSDPDKAKRVSAARALAYIGNEQGIAALRNALKSEADKEAKSAMSSFLAGGLVGTTSQGDLDFLRSSIETARFGNDEDESALPAISAALTLGMMGRKDSIELLRKVAKEDTFGSEEIGKALCWIENKSVTPRATTSLTDDETVKSIVLDGTFFAEQERDKTSVTELTFNRGRNKVLVGLEIYLNPKSARGYDLILAKRNGEWRIVGIWFAWIA